MDSIQTTLIVGAVGSILAFLGTVLNTLITLYKERRTREWLLEDARILREQVRLDKEELKKDLAANTEISVKAFNEANNVNEKLLRLGQAQLVKNELPKEVIVVNEEPIPFKEVK